MRNKYLKNNDTVAGLLYKTLEEIREIKTILIKESLKQTSNKDLLIISKSAGVIEEDMEEMSKLAEEELKIRLENE